MTSFTFYFDRCFGSKLPALIEKANPPFNVQYHNKVGFKHNASDDEWLSHVGDQDWIVLSHDARFHRDALALKAIEQFKVRCFYLWGGQLPTWEKLVFFATATKHINVRVKSHKSPFIFLVNSTGRLKKIL